MQAAGEFDLILRQATGIAKAPYVAEFVRLLVQNGERVLLFGWAPRRLRHLDGAAQGSEPHAVHRHGERDAESRLAAGLHPGRQQGTDHVPAPRRGVDGLQHTCKTVVFGELDWSPGVHEQCIGRVHRDGQPDPVMAYFLISDSGSDPVVAEICGVKLEQIEGVRNPSLGMAERIDTGDSHIRKLAEAYLAAHGTAGEGEGA